MTTDVTTAIASFSIAAALLTITPGIDTALVLRTAALEGPRRALLAGAGIVSGVLVWGLAASIGLGALLAASKLAYRAVQVAGALYLGWLGISMLRAAFRRPVPVDVGFTAEPEPGQRHANWFLRGALTNLLNPKVGVFYVSFLPQFMPTGVSVLPFSMLLAGIHAVMGLMFFAVVAAISMPLGRALNGPRLTRLLDGVTGAVLVLFALRLAFAQRSPGG